MKFSMSFIFLITIYILPMIYSQSSKPLPGSSACTYYATVDGDCLEPIVPVNKLPQDCSSYIYNDIRPDSSLNMTFGYPNISNEDLLNSLLGSGKSTFLYYNRLSFETEWLPVLQNSTESTKTEMANLKTFLKPYKNISGLILEGLSIPAGANDTASISENLKAYLDEMKACFPDYSIGIDMYGPAVAQYYDEPNPSPYLDVSILGQCIDFYVINFFRLNGCTEEFQVGGEIPINGTAPYTIDKTRGHVTDLGIQKEKLYFYFRTGPWTLDSEFSDTSACERTLAKVCESPTLDGYCSDNTQSYYDKGAYAKQYGAGFIAAGVDLHDDPYDSCQCGTPYPAFNDILAGYNGGPVPPPCPLLDKN